MGPAILVLMSALLLTLAATALTALFFQRIPASQRAALANANLNSRFSEMFKSAKPEAREGRAFWELAGDVSRAIAPNAKTTQISNNRVQAALAATSSQLGRLLAAGAVFAVAENEGRTPEQVWAAVRPYLEGLATARFARFEPAHEAFLASVFHVGAVQSGTARQLASEMAEAYTPFLQYFVDKLNKCAAERLTAGDAAAAELCRKIKLRLLRDCTLEPGRAGTRLLAADLLGRELAGEPAAKPAVDAIAKWRKAYRMAARANPGGFFSQTNDPDMSGGLARLLASLLLGSIGLAIATFVLAVAGIASAWPLLTNAKAIRSPRAWTVGVLCALLVLVIGVAVLGSGFQAAQDDLNGAMQRMARAAAPAHKSETWLPLYWARLPWNAAAVGAVAAVAAYLGGRVAGVGQQNRSAASVAICWLCVALIWAATAGLGLVRLSAYESRIDAAYRNGTIATVMGDAGDAMLGPVREWQP